MTRPDEWPADDELRDDELVELGYEDGDEPDHFARVMYYVLDFPGLSRVAKDAYVCLVRGLGWGKRRRRMTRVQLAAVMSISTDTFDRGIKDLVKHGLVEVIRQRDPQTGNWATSSYLLKDTKSARLRARIVELEQALGKSDTKSEENPQVNPGPQNAARTDEDNPGDEGGDHSADCGTGPTCDDDPSPQAGTSPQNAEPPGRNLRNRRAADCGHTREGFQEREEKTEKRENPGVPAAGGRTRRNARGAAAPAAQPRSSIKGAALLAEVERYRQAPGWVKARHLAPLATRALDRFGADAVVRYARMVAEEGRYLDDQHIPEFREVLRRLGRDAALGTACPRDGLPPDTCPCSAAAADTPAPDRAWSAEDQADWERILEQFTEFERDLDEREGEQ